MNSIPVDVRSRAFDLTEVADACGDLGALSSMFREAVLRVGMTASACGMVSGPRLRSGDVFHFVNWPAEWLEVYRSQSMIEIDAVPRWALASGRPVSWSEVLDGLAPDDPGHRVYTMASEWGFTEGYVTPVRTEEGWLGLVSVGGGRGPLAPEEQVFLQALSSVTLHRAERLSSPGLPPPRLGLIDRKAGDAPARVARRRGEVLASGEELKRAFELTPAELPDELYVGLSLREVCDGRAVSISTLRTHLGSLFHKTGTHKQLDLIRLLEDVVRSGAGANAPLR